VKITLLVVSLTAGILFVTMCRIVGVQRWSHWKRVVRWSLLLRRTSKSTRHRFRILSLHSWTLPSRVNYCGSLTFCTTATQVVIISWI